MSAKPQTAINATNRKIEGNKPSAIFVLHFQAIKLMHVYNNWHL